MSTQADCTAESPNTARSIQISKKAVIVGAAVVFLLYLIACILTLVLEKGSYLRDETGAIISGTYVEDASLEGLKWWQYFAAPVMILNPAADGSGTVWAILFLLIIIGAIFTALDESGILVYMVQWLNHRFGAKKHILLFVLPFTFMFLGSTAGMFEELIPLVPVVVMLCYALGWDSLTGLAITVLASCFGFTAGVVNPFTVGVAQTLGGLQMYSGIGLRILVFVIAYAVLMGFLYPYVRKIQKQPQKSPVYAQDLERKAQMGVIMNDFTPDAKKGRALIWFGCWMLGVVIFALLAIIINRFVYEGFADYIMYVTLVIYVAAGIGACLICGLRGKTLLKQLGKGTLTLLPAVAMILIAGGIRYIIEEGDIMDTILYHAVNALGGASPFGGTLIIYGIIFVFEMFIPSGSAKAFLLMPMIYDMMDLMLIDRQVAVLAFTFADGFANVLLPTNAGLLLILGMTAVDYGKWFKWSIKIQGTLLAITIGILALAQFAVYA